MKSLEQSAYEGDTVNISCKFPQEYKRKPKYFCKESGGQGCKYNLSTQWNQARVRDEKLSLHDDREEGVLTVSISSFSTSDAGSYWCGVEMDKYHALITNVKLTLTGTFSVCILTLIIIPSTPLHHLRMLHVMLFKDSRPEMLFLRKSYYYLH